MTGGLMYRGTCCARTSPLPLLPSGPGGVGGIAPRRARHGASLPPGAFQQAGPADVTLSYGSGSGLDRSRRLGSSSCNGARSAPTPHIRQAGAGPRQPPKWRRLTKLPAGLRCLCRGCKTEGAKGCCAPASLVGANAALPIVAMICIPTSSVGTLLVSEIYLQGVCSPFGKARRRIG